MTWAELPIKLKAYIILLSAIGIPVIAWAILDLFSNNYNNDWIILTFLVILTDFFFLRLPSANNKVTIGIGDTYIMAIAMMYGIAPCIIATFINTFIISYFAQKPNIYKYKIFFNTSSMILGALIYSTIYKSLNHGSLQLNYIIVPSAVMVSAYFLINSILTSISVSWSIGENVTKFWIRTCMPLAVNFYISSFAATTIAILHRFNDYIPIAAAPLVGILWGLNHLKSLRSQEAINHLKEQEQLYFRTVESLALAVDAKDQTTYGHIRRVNTYAIGLAKLCSIKNENELKAINTGALLHDIGKLAIDDYILNKPGRLSKQEFEKIKLHTTAGDEILQMIHFPFPVATFVRHHHERWDGLGYPDGLKGGDIPLGARILAIADAFDAIHYSRPYKLSIGIDESIELLRAQSGTVYDPNLVQLFIDHVEELEQAAEKALYNVPELSFRKYFQTIDNALLAEANSLTIIPAKSTDYSLELLQFADFCNSFDSSFGPEEFLPIISRKILHLIPYTSCVFYLDEGNDYIRSVFADGKFSDIFNNFSIRMGKGISGWSAAYKRPMINSSPTLDFQGIKGDFSCLSDVLVVPLIYRDESIGTISLYAQAPITFNQHNLSILQTLSSFLAPLISKSIRNPVSLQEYFLDPNTSIHRIAYLTSIGPPVLSFAENNHSPVSLIYLDVNNLHQLVRLYGFDIRNLILRKSADSIRPELRENDILVRYGNHGFVIFLPGVNEDQALRCVQRFLRQARHSISTASSNHSFLINYNVGVASFPKDGSTVLALLQSAQNKVEPILTDTTSTDNIVEFLPRLF